MAIFFQEHFDLVFRRFTRVAARLLQRAALVEASCAFEPNEAPQFRTDMRWNMKDFLSYFETRSSSVKYREAIGAHPTT